MNVPRSFLFNNRLNIDLLARKFGLLIILALALLLLLPGTARLPLIDRDEPRFTEATREMMEGGEWFVPYFNGDYRFDKPILTYWLMAPGLALAQRLPFFSPELGARLHSIVSTVLLGWVVFLLGKRWFSPRTGLLAGCGIVSCVQVIMHGRSAVADMPMVVCVALSMWALYELLHSTAPTRRYGHWFFLLYLSLGFGFLAKGPVAWLVPLLSLLLYRFLFWRKKLPWGNLQVLSGVLICLTIVAVWGVPALIKTDGLFWQKGMGEHVMERGVSTMAGFGHFFFYYLISSFISLFPWIAYAAFGFQHLRENWNSKNAFLCAWIVSTYLFFSFYFTQLPHYVMPCFAALFLLVGQIADSPCAFKRWTFIWFRTILLAPCLLALIIFVFAVLYPFDPVFLPIRKLLFAASAGLIGLVIIGWSPMRGKAVLFIAGILLLMLTLHIAGTILRQSSVTVQLGSLTQTLPADTKLLSTGFNEPGVVFYSHRRWERHGDMDHEIRNEMMEPGPRAVLLLDREKPLEYFFRQEARTRFGINCRLKQKDFSADNDALPTNGYSTVFLEGFNPARTSWATVRVYYKQE